MPNELVRSPSFAPMLLRALAITVLSVAPLIGQSPASRAAPAPLRLGVIGLTHDHVHWLFGRMNDGDFDVVGIVEPNRALVQRYANQYGFRTDLVVNSMAELFEKSRPTAVAAFGSTFDHLSIVQAAAPRGIHVMVEKPLAVSLDHAKQMKALADRHRIILMVNYETSWYPTVHAANELLRTGSIGELRKVVVHDGHKGPEKIGVSREFLSWLLDPVQNGGGAITDFGCYGANLMTFLMQGQRPSSVTAVLQQLQPADYPRVDDEATIILVYPRAQAIIQASWNWPIARKDMEIYGEQGVVIAENRNTLRTRLSERAAEMRQRMPERTAPYHDPFAYFKALVEKRITPGRYDLSSIDNNMIVMEILDAAVRSARQGTTVRLGSN
jgi:predicted dehydrogenase